MEISTLKTDFFLEKCLSAALQTHLPMAVWRLPNTKNSHWAIDFSGNSSIVQTWNDLPTGFLFAPFDTSQKNFIYADWYYNTENEQVSESYRSQIFGSLHQKNKEIFVEKLKQADTKVFFPKKEHTQTTQKEAFCELVEKAVEQIEAGVFQKVVVSRTQHIDFEQLNLAYAFQQLADRYANAFVCLLVDPQAGIWLGASPEILISQDKKGIFRTVALAGTQAKNDQTIRKAVWSQKEIEEQAFVSRYIVNCFKKIRLREFEETGPRTVAAGNLLHLRTDFEVDTKTLNFEELPQVMLELLHPTSAVCGMPKESAKKFILENEAHQRQLYSGYWGAINLDSEHHLFVNLRCMQVFDKKAVLYAGCGITLDSLAEKEWEETKMKCQTVASVVFN